MSLQLQGLTQAVSATTSIGTATFSTCTTNAFVIDNANSTVFAYVNVFTSREGNSFNHPTTAGQTGASIVVPPQQSRVIVGDFGSSGGGQTVYVNHITAANSATLIISPVTLRQAGTDL